MKPTTASAAATALPTMGQMDQQVDGEDLREGAGSRPVRGKASRSRMIVQRDDEALSLQAAAMEYIWLYDYRHGVCIKKIAARAQVSVDRVRFGVERAKAQESKLSRDDRFDDSTKSGRPDEPGFRLLPLFPIGAFTPQSACSHRDPMEPGSRLCCMVCHASGMDDHPGLRRDSQSDPSPEPEPVPSADGAVPAESVEPKRNETRKQRRRRQFAEVAVA